MSVINQMLNGLEQRGVQVAADQVRPVHTVRDTARLKWLLGALLLVVVLPGLAWLKWPVQPPVPVVAVAQQIVVAPAVPVATSSVPASAPEVIAVPDWLPDVEKVIAEIPARPVETVTQKVQAAVNLPRKEEKVLPAKKSPEVARPSSLPSPVSHQDVNSKAIENTAERLPLKQISTVQQADAEFRKAVSLMQQGASSEAVSGFEAALQLDAGHEGARRSLVALLLEGKRNAEAEQLLQNGLNIKPSHSGFAMLLARIQVERGAQDQAITTLESALPHAVQQADYQAFYAALLQRKGRHQEALEHYQLALKSAPNSGVWLMGSAISWQALNRPVEARGAYQAALDTQSLSVELQNFVRRKLIGL